MKLEFSQSAIDWQMLAWDYVGKYLQLHVADADFLEGKTRRVTGHQCPRDTDHRIGEPRRVYRLVRQRTIPVT